MQLQQGDPRFQGSELMELLRHFHGGQISESESRK